MSHRHPDPSDPGNTYGMPSRPCSRCSQECCTDCSVRRDGQIVCESCEYLLSMTDAGRERATR